MLLRAKGCESGYNSKSNGGYGHELKESGVDSSHKVEQRIEPPNIEQTEDDAKGEGQKPEYCLGFKFKRHRGKCWEMWD